MPGSENQDIHRLANINISATHPTSSTIFLLENYVRNTAQNIEIDGTSRNYIP